MSWIGRIVGALLGFKVAGFWGALLGFILGVLLDRARVRFSVRTDPVQRQRIEQTLFNTVFPLLGYMAKADGRVSEEEIQTAETLMTRMQLTGAMRKEAIQLFKQGTVSTFNLSQTMAAFMAICGPFADIKQLILAYLVSMAMSDGELHATEITILKEVSSFLGYSPLAFEHFLRMSQAQERFHKGGYSRGDDARGGSYERATPAQDLASAYAALGVESSDSDADIKRAYRKLMSQYHPDKLVGQGVPEDMVKVATERTQEIQAAYDLIKKHRN